MRSDATITYHTQTRVSLILLDALKKKAAQAGKGAERPRRRITQSAAQAASRPGAAPAHFRRNKYRWFAEPESGRCPNGSLKNLHLRFEDGDKYRGKQQRENECRFL
jgi:hypothetical protein